MISSVVGAAVLSLVIGGAVGFTFGDRGTDDEPDGGVPMRAGAAPDGFPSASSANLPASLATTLAGCERSEEIVYGQNTNKTTGVACPMFLNGYAGVFAYAEDTPWINDAVNAAPGQPDHQELNVPGFEAYSYTWNTGSVGVPVVTLVGPDHDYYMDMHVIGYEDGAAPTQEESQGFYAALAEAMTS